METKPVRSHRREIETPAYLAMLRRMVRAASIRVGGGDAEDLAKLVAIETELHHQVGLAVRDLRASGHTWKMLGDATGTTPQAALMKWGR